MVFAAIILASFFMPWVSFPPNDSMSPAWAVWNMTQFDRMLLGNIPVAGKAFFLGCALSFIMAGVLLVVGLRGSAPRLLALATGALPVGLVAWAIVSIAMVESPDGGSPLGNQIIRDVIYQMLGFGAVAWLFAAGGLLGLAIVNPAATRFDPPATRA